MRYIKLFCIFALIFTSLSGLPAEEKDWEGYYEERIKDTEPYKTLTIALMYFRLDGTQKGKALDLGAGAGGDTIFLLEKGWKVHAVDAEQHGLDIIAKRATEKLLNNLTLINSNFEDLQLTQQYNLINASLSLPFCAPEHFDRFWQQISDHLQVGGRFSGQFFGDRDQWASSPFMTFHSHEQVLELFSKHFEIEYIQIEEGLLPTATGPMKKWHIFHVVAKKIK